MDRYDVIVIGGGHAGSEAAALAARRGAHTLLLTQSLDTIGQMSCNPAIGGIAKGTVVREVDALGGVMGRATDQACIQFRMLNRSKGPAVWSPRAQCDRALYRQAVRRLLESHPLLDLRQGTVARLLVTSGRVNGVETLCGSRISAAAVVITAGTFLRGRIHQGLDAPTAAGRAGDPAVIEIAQALADLGLTAKRFKTGTPPRVDGRTVNLGKLQRQDGDPGEFWFSFHQESATRPQQLPCYLTHTGVELKKIVQHHLASSALYGGAIASRGPRYCPSIEDKIVKFPDVEGHQVFLEPEGLGTCEMYVNGLSTSLPPSVQLEFLRTVRGLEQVKMTRAGYAIEYDYFPPTQLQQTLEAKTLAGLFLAGQVNGTTGYEEAAAQGVVAGINAAGSALGSEMLRMSRGVGFIGVLIDDLVHRGVDEPYRLFTSRSEYRLLLRQDNALRRMLPLGRSFGTLTSAEVEHAEQRLETEDRLLQRSQALSIPPSAANPLLLRFSSEPINETVKISELAKRPEAPLRYLLAAVGIDAPQHAAEWADIELKYGGYLAREQAAAKRAVEMEHCLIPEELSYPELRGLSFEAREKLGTVRPRSLGEASRIPGVSPADIHNLLSAILSARGRRQVSRETAEGRGKVARETSIANGGGTTS
jgi:tRNA uridine 5-carboxymethylaminomethyl modification enzyme